MSVSSSLEPLRESKFHSQIRAAAEDQDDSTFHLLLAMVTQDAQELDAFHLPHTKEPEIRSDIKRQFFIQDKPLYGPSSLESAARHNRLIKEGFKSSMHLSLHLRPEPLQQAVYDIAQEVFDNLDFNARQRLLKSASTKEEKPNERDVEHDEVDVEAWFNVLKQARIYSKFEAAIS